MCVYTSCRYGCITKEEHHSKYARMRKNSPTRIEEIHEVKKSSKVNWNMVEELGLELKLNRPNIRRKLC